MHPLWIFYKYIFFHFDSLALARFGDCLEQNRFFVGVLLNTALFRLWEAFRTCLNSDMPVFQLW